MWPIPDGHDWCSLSCKKGSFPPFWMSSIALRDTQRHQNLPALLSCGRTFLAMAPSSPKSSLRRGWGSGCQIPHRGIYPHEAFWFFSSTGALSVFHLCVWVLTHTVPWHSCSQQCVNPVKMAGSSSSPTVTCLTNPVIPTAGKLGRGVGTNAKRSWQTWWWSKAWRSRQDPSHLASSEITQN